jgi:hypothetical protein
VINFRFHLVSLTAVFLALAVGILLGASVVNGGLVDGLQGQLSSVKENVSRVDQQNESLRRDLGAWEDFATTAAPGLLGGRLQGVPVLLLGVRGIESDRIDELRSDLVSADAQLQGTLWLPSRMRLDRQEDVKALSEAFDLGTQDAEFVRGAVFDRLARELAAGGSSSSPTSTVPVPTDVATTLPGATTTTAAVAPRGSVLAALATAGFIDIDSPETGRFDTRLPLPNGTRFVVVSGDGADVPDSQGAIPLVRALAAASGSGTRVVAAEPGRPAAGREPEVRSRYIGPLRAVSKELENRISTVNNVEDPRGRVAVVLALVDLGVGRVGHYGVGSGADRLVPESG